MNTKRGISLFAAVAAASCVFAFTVPSAEAADDNAVVTSSRSFPKTQSVRKNLFAESTSTSAGENENWGGVENLDVPQTESQAERDAKAAAEAAAQAAAEAQAQAAAQAQAQAASRSSQRETLSSSSQSSSSSSSSGAVSAPASASAQAVASYASQFVGAPYVYGGSSPSGWDCSGFVAYVYSQFGISLPRTSGAQAAVGTAVGSIAEAQPGDIIANSGHAAIYIGNGLVVNALNPAQGTQITGLGVFNGGYSIRRVL
ncbi:MAG: C40 family peptidase [Bifidobacterium scardovii]|uniref:C40 family peptidase n=1 Tax=Bifidobacterium scardovii TaxID=158787 RepID=UPI000665C7E9|nr:C40 family peptidase [Bifidobacterium scardovii]MBS6948645.1 C40 family peptidase [Bifidobacterium scardovii]MDU3737739.1 C40 family peptidase [Bifidobacterium scardovii]MDU5298355.1 C40 family peptidase [Bifidobacterium scardovii]MDU5612119.1 C40 family peptidase [Bifidobacterium scardovii]MDU5887996.1 C40 family peptidase [Bifidobacterium scardovii]